ncbi:MAG: hypothetical protein FWD46_08525 [Cystobacterineae bacterium]|nr:hypothetical protein [Cystobacterineae bacterium]
MTERMRAAIPFNVTLLFERTGLKFCPLMVSVAPWGAALGLKLLGGLIANLHNRHECQEPMI